MKEPSILVVNTSPLIHLAEAGLLGLLQEAAASIYVPEPVAREIRAYGEDETESMKLSPNITAEFNADGDLIGIEILKASTFLRDYILESTQAKLMQLKQSVK